MCNYFAMINDTGKAVKILLDQKLLDADAASFHPMDNTGSTAIRKDGILKLKELSGRDDTQFEIIDFAKLAGGAGGDEGGKQKPAKQPKEKKEGPKVEQGKKLTKEEKK